MNLLRCAYKLPKYNNFHRVSTQTFNKWFLVIIYEKEATVRVRVKKSLIPVVLIGYSNTRDFGTNSLEKCISPLRSARQEKQNFRSLSDGPLLALYFPLSRAHAPSWVIQFNKPCRKWIVINVWALFVHTHTHTRTHTHIHTHTHTPAFHKKRRRRAQYPRNERKGGNERRKRERERERVRKTTRRFVRLR